MDTTKSRFSSNLPRVSIVTPSFNQGGFIERTILSVLRQDYANIEYIVMDSRSDDATVGILKKYQGKISRIVREKDKGQSDAVNKGFSLATGEILAYLNSDDCYAGPEVVSKAVDYFLAHQEVDMLYGRRYYIDQNGFLIIAHPFRQFNKERMYKADYIGQECTFWTREIYDRAGGFIDTTFRFALDYELFLRFLQHNANIDAVDELFGLFRWYPDQKSNAAWENVGIPEIAQLQKKYLGYVVDVQQMYAIFEEHFAGVNKFSHPVVATIYSDLWHLETHIKRMVLGLAPMDHWVFLQSEHLRNIKEASYLPVRTPSASA